MYTFVVVVQVIAALAVIGLVLLQQGKGADAGAAFGSGASGTVFGARGSANFLTRATAACATVFFISSLSLTYMGQGRKPIDSVVETVGVHKTEAAPATPPKPGDQAPAAAPGEPAKPETPKVPE